MTPDDILALLDPSTPDTWPQGILAAADLREQVTHEGTDGLPAEWTNPRWLVRYLRTQQHVAEHIAAEANPAHALAAVRHWKGVAGRHRVTHLNGLSVCTWCACDQEHPEDDPGDGDCFTSWPCPDLTETADDARAYLGGVS